MLHETRWVEVSSSQGLGGNKRLHLYLLNDRVVVAAQKQRSFNAKWLVEHVWMLSDISLNDLNDTGKQHSFLMTFDMMQETSYVLAMAQRRVFIALIIVMLSRLG